jgi:hypothetical protein
MAVYAPLAANSAPVTNNLPSQTAGTRAADITVTNAPSAQVSQSSTTAATYIQPTAAMTIQTPSPPVVVADRTNLPGAPQLMPYNQSEVEHLNTEIRMLKEFQTSILQTVYWSLGVVIAIAVVLIGYNWVTAYKIYDRDKQTLRQDILNDQTQKHVELEGKVTAALNSFNETSQQFTSEVTEKLSTSLTSAEEKFLALRDETGKQRSELDEQLRGFIKTSLTDLESRLKIQLDITTLDFNKQLKDLNYKVRTDAFYLHDNLGDDNATRNFWSAAYSYHFKALEAAILLNNDIWITEAFNKVIAALDHAAKLSPREKLAAEELVRKSPEKYKVQAAQLSERAKKAELWEQP